MKRESSPDPAADLSAATGYEKEAAMLFPSRKGQILPLA
jgi:hypothetical protein